MNAFSGLQSSFISRQGGTVFGQSIENYKDEEWGHLIIHRLIDQDNIDIVDTKLFIRDLDDNEHDSTIVAYQLHQPILPGETRTLELDFSVKMPRLIARSGYSLASYYLFVHWFPQMCVYEEQEGRWQWNSHQFVPGTEFYADFGKYRVSLDLPADMVVGATGCRTHYLQSGGRQVVTYVAEDVIDFGWVTYPHFDVYRDQWEDIEIELLLAPEHSAQAERMITATKQGLAYLREHVGPYAYSKITVVGPPLHALRSGLMEYPMMITCGSAYGLPEGIRTLESLVIHELTHQYFMAVLANNEKEEAWMDEGFVTYYEDRIIDHYYGKTSGLIDILGYKVGNAQKSRNEYLNMGDLTNGTIGRPGWEFDFGAYKELIYAKSATLLKTVEALLGTAVMDQMMRSYYEEYRYTHPTGQDFIGFVKAFVDEQGLPYRGSYIAGFLTAGIYDNSYYDAAVLSVETTGDQHRATITNHGDLDLPVDVLWTFTDGHTFKERILDMNSGTLDHTYNGALASITIDPDHNNYLDADYSNNTWVPAADHAINVSFSGRTAYWVQSFLHLLTTVL